MREEIKLTLAELNEKLGKMASEFFNDAKFLLIQEQVKGRHDITAEWLRGLVNALRYERRYLHQQIAALEAQLAKSEEQRGVIAGTSARWQYEYETAQFDLNRKGSELREVRSFLEPIAANHDGRGVMGMAEMHLARKVLALLSQSSPQTASSAETAAIMADPKLYARLLKTATTIDKDMREGKLHSWDEVMNEDEPERPTNSEEGR